MYCEIFTNKLPLEKIKTLAPQAVILSGGPSSVYDPGAPTLPAGFWEYQAKANLSVLGICYGMQLMVHELGGKVSQANTREYGKMDVHPDSASSFSGTAPIYRLDESWG